MLAGEFPETLVLLLVLDFLAWRLTRRFRRLRFRRHRTGASIALAPYMARPARAV